MPLTYDMPACNFGITCNVVTDATVERWTVRSHTLAVSLKAIDTYL